MPVKTVFGLIDCNNFFASCERVFQPRLLGRPVVVLSSNDGCVVARSNEVKSLGVPMGVPAFKYRTLFDEHKVEVFSSNFALYQDMARRVVCIIKHFCADVEIYSIDECFLDLACYSIKSYQDYGLSLRRTIGQWTGLPASVGIGSTKTLAKAAATLAKNMPAGVLDFTSCNVDDYLYDMPVSKVWGVGYRLERLLGFYGIKTAYQLKQADLAWIRRRFSVALSRTAQELNGLSCFGLISKTDKLNQTIASTRSFGQPVNTITELNQAIANFTAKAAYKLRRQGGATGAVLVFINTGRHSSSNKYLGKRTIFLPTATSYTPVIIKAALTALKYIYRSGYYYKQAGVILSQIIPQNHIQLNLLDQIKQSGWRKRLRFAKTLDNLNQKWGTDTVWLAAEGFNQNWQAKQAKRSPHYTTDWSELPLVKC